MFDNSNGNLCILGRAFLCRTRHFDSHHAFLCRTMHFAAKLGFFGVQMSVMICVVDQRHYNGIT